MSTESLLKFISCMFSGVSLLIFISLTVSEYIYAIISPWQCDTELGASKNAMQRKKKKKKNWPYANKWSKEKVDLTEL